MDKEKSIRETDELPLVFKVEVKVNKMTFKIG